MWETATNFIRKSTKRHTIVTNSGSNTFHLLLCLYVFLERHRSHHNHFQVTLGNSYYILYNYMIHIKCYIVLNFTIIYSKTTIFGTQIYQIW